MNTDYLARALARSLEERLAAVQVARRELLLDHTRRGVDRSSGHLTLIEQEYERLLKEGAQRAAKHAFDAVGLTGGDVLAEHLSSLRTRFLADLTAYFLSFSKRSGWAAGLGEKLTAQYAETSENIVEAYVDDFRHGILDGVKLVRDPALTVTDSILNSPGAIQQRGTGNILNANIQFGAPDAIKKVLGEFLHSPEVAGLSQEDRDSIFDLSELITGELAKTDPDPSRLGRFGKYVLDAAERLGVAVAAQGLARALFG